MSVPPAEVNIKQVTADLDETESALLRSIHGRYLKVLQARNGLAQQLKQLAVELERAYGAEQEMGKTFTVMAKVLGDKYFGKGVPFDFDLKKGILISKEGAHA